MAISDRPQKIRFLIRSETAISDNPFSDNVFRKSRFSDRMRLLSENVVRNGAAGCRTNHSTAAQHTGTQQQTTASPRCVGFHHFCCCCSCFSWELSLIVTSRISPVAWPFVRWKTSLQQWRNVVLWMMTRCQTAMLALALATMDQIEDDEEGIVAAVDYRFVKFYSSRFSVCLRRREVLQ